MDSVPFSPRSQGNTATNRTDAAPSLPSQRVQSRRVPTPSKQEMLANYVVGGPAEPTFSRKLTNDRETEGRPGVARLGRRPQKEAPWGAEGTEGPQFTRERGSEGDGLEGGGEGEGQTRGIGKF